eukprot:COSAG04_NODE_3271_length_2989_cov_2.298513_4_plen_96_part_00
MSRYSADNNAAYEAMFGDLGSPGGAFEVGSIPPAGNALDNDLDQTVCDDEMVGAAAGVPAELGSSPLGAAAEGGDTGRGSGAAAPASMPGRQAGR